MGQRLDTLLELIATPSRTLPRPWLRVAWVLSILLVVGANLLYVLTQDDWSWWVAGAAVLPLLLLILEKHFEDPGPSDGVMGDGPWGPPDA